jgi:hypothetical protein
MIIDIYIANTNRRTSEIDPPTHESDMRSNLIEMSIDMEPVGFHYGNVARSTRADMQPVPHSITSSARVSMVGGTSTPIAFKVGRLRHC